MPDPIDSLIRETIIALGERRDEITLVKRFGRHFIVAHRKRVFFRRIQWFSVSVVGVAPWWWPEDWVLGEGAINFIESLQNLIVSPTLIESAITGIKTLLG